MQFMFQVTGTPLGNGDDDVSDVHAIVIDMPPDRMRQLENWLEVLKDLHARDTQIVELSFDDPVWLYGRDLLDAVEEKWEGEDVWPEDSDWTVIPDDLSANCECLASYDPRLRMTLFRDDMHELVWSAFRMGSGDRVETRPATLDLLRTGYDIDNAKHPS